MNSKELLDDHCRAHILSRAAILTVHSTRRLQWHNHGTARRILQWSRGILHIHLVRSVLDSGVRRSRLEQLRIRQLYFNVGEMSERGTWKHGNASQSEIRLPVLAWLMDRTCKRADAASNFTLSEFDFIMSTNDVISSIEELSFVGWKAFPFIGDDGGLFVSSISNERNRESGVFDRSTDSYSFLPGVLISAESNWWERM